MSNKELIARARAYVQPSLDRDLWNTGIQAVLDVCTILEDTDNLAAAHTTDLREQSKHYAVKAMNSDDGRDE